MTSHIEVLEIGAGHEPQDEATRTLDIRDDLDHIDYPGVDIGADEWPVEKDTVSKIIGHHVFEHIPPQNISHVFKEAYRVLEPGGKVHLEMPHAGTYFSATDPTHQGTGGTTADLDGYFDPDHPLEDYWPEIDWDAEAWAEIEFPRFVRPSWQRTIRVEDGFKSLQLVKFPYVTGTVTFEAQIPVESN